MFSAVALSWFVTPGTDSIRSSPIGLEGLVPREFGGWKEVPSLLAHVDLAVRRDEKDLAAQLYDDVLARTYRGPTGELIMLSIAYGSRQRQESKIHRPELCYTSQGFEIGAVARHFLSLSPMQGSLPVKVFLASAPSRNEHVVYWIRIGDAILESAMRTRLKILGDGLKGVVPDGILVRASTLVQIGPDQPDPQATIETFLRSLMAAMGPGELAALVPPLH